MHMSQQCDHMSNILATRHAVHYKHPISLQSLCSRETLQQNKCENQDSSSVRVRRAKENNSYRLALWS